MNTACLATAPIQEAHPLRCRMTRSRSRFLFRFSAMVLFREGSMSVCVAPSMSTSSSSSLSSPQPNCAVCWRVFPAGLLAAGLAMAVSSNPSSLSSGGPCSMILSRISQLSSPSGVPPITRDPASLTPSSVPPKNVEACSPISGLESRGCRPRFRWLRGGVFAEVSFCLWWRGDERIPRRALFASIAGGVFSRSGS